MPSLIESYAMTGSYPRETWSFFSGKEGAKDLWKGEGELVKVGGEEASVGMYCMREE